MKSKSQDCCVTFKHKNYLKILLSVQAQTSQANILHLARRVRPVHGFVVSFSSLWHDSDQIFLFLFLLIFFFSFRFFKEFIILDLAVSWPSQILPTEQRKIWNSRLLLVSLRWSGAFPFSQHVTDVCNGQWSFWDIQNPNLHRPECTESTLAQFSLRSLKKSLNSFLSLAFWILNQNGTWFFIVLGQITNKSIRVC